MKNQTKRFFQFLDYKDNPFEVSIINPQNKTSGLWEGKVHGKGLVTGYFDDPKKVVSLLPRINKSKSEGVYVSLNPCRGAVRERADNEFKPNINRTKNEDIRAIRNILIDVDPIRPANTIATDSQRKMAKAVARLIRRDLSDTGFGEPLMVSSGNGYQLIYKAKLKNNPERTRLVSSFLRVLSKKYNNGAVKIDTSVSDPARLVRLPGTYNRKGVPSDDYPHRKAQAIIWPKDPVILNPSQIKGYIEGIEGGLVDAGTGDKRDEGRVDVEAYLAGYGVALHSIKDYRGGKMYCLEECVFNKTHTPNDASIIQGPDGKIFFQCFHDSCNGLRWEDAKRVISGDAPLTKYLGDMPTTLEEDYRKARIISFDKLLETDWPSEPPVINGLLEETGGLILSGMGGIGKSMISLNVALNLAFPPSDSRLFGLFKIPKPVNTLFIQSEGTANYQKKRLELMIRDNPSYKNAQEHLFTPEINRDIRLHGDIRDDRFLDTIREWVYQADARLLVLDPLISYHSENESGNMEMRKVLDRLTFKICAPAQVAVLLIHHSGKTADSWLRGASSIADWATSIIHLSPIKKGGEELIRVEHKKSRNFKKGNPFLLRMTPGFQYERVTDKAEKSDATDQVKDALERLGGQVETQKVLVDELVKQAGLTESTALRAIKKAEKKGLIEGAKKGKEMGYRLATIDSDE
jgi:RecA-family ATPase